MAEKTLFQQIYDGEVASTIIYKDDLVFAIDDIYPEAPVHILIIPIEAIATVADVEVRHEAILGRLFTVARRLAEERELSHNGYRLVVNCKAHAGQEVYHVHMHLLGGKKLGGMV